MNKSCLELAFESNIKAVFILIILSPWNWKIYTWCSYLDKWINSILVIFYSQLGSCKCLVLAALAMSEAWSGRFPLEGCDGPCCLGSATSTDGFPLPAAYPCIYLKLKTCILGLSWGILWTVYWLGLTKIDLFSAKGNFSLLSIWEPPYHLLLKLMTSTIKPTILVKPLH